jgi:hypothetical protein
MKLGLRTLVFMGVFVLIKAKPRDIHPPIWEYTYQYELFEKIYSQVQQLQRETTRLRLDMLQIGCPQHWMAGNLTCYRLPLHRKLDWFQADEVCERIGGHLAILDTEEENSFVSQLLNETRSNENLGLENIWIGGFSAGQAGTWHWVNGKAVRYTNWKTEPDAGNVTSENEHCLDWSGVWNVNTCTRKLHYLCEKYPKTS